jgi:hypothetical protein
MDVFYIVSLELDIKIRKTINHNSVLKIWHLIRRNIRTPLVNRFNVVNVVLKQELTERI